MASFTRKALADTLIEMMRSQPLDKITVADLTRECGVNYKTFYYHFRGMSDLLQQVIVNQVARRAGGATDVETWARCVLEYVKDNQPLLKNAIQSSYYPEVRVMLEERLRALVAAEARRVANRELTGGMRLGEADADELVAQLTDQSVTIYLALAESWILRGAPGEARERFELTRSIMGGGLSRALRDRCERAGS